MVSIKRALIIQGIVFVVFVTVLWLAADSWESWCYLMAGLGGMCNFVALTQRERQIEKHEEDE
jgi:Flp pilus assembly protein TadB